MTCITFQMVGIQEVLNGIYFRPSPPCITIPISTQQHMWCVCYACMISDIDSSPPSATYMRRWILSALVQIMACRLFGAKPFSKPMLGQYQLWHVRTKFSETLIKMQHFSFTKIHLKISSGKWRPFCLDLNVLMVFTGGEVLDISQF